MARVVRTFPARDDLRQIWLHIANDNLTAADQFIDEIERMLILLARNPQIGQAVDRYRVGLRQFTVGKYVLYFESVEEGIRLVRVLHGARKIEELFP
jgi:toxin ParE1/3/4